jgi:hypothetical protein
VSAVEIVRPEHVVFMAHDRRRPAGYIALHPEADAAILVDHVLIAPGNEGRRIAHRLLAYAEGYAISKRAARL